MGSPSMVVIFLPCASPTGTTHDLCALPSMCTVHVDGKAQRSCVVPVGDVQGKKITTIEGLPKDHPVKKAWVQEQVPQCGWCQPGMMMQVAALMAESPNPDPNKIISAMDDVICRCGSYPEMKKGIKTAVEMAREGGKKS